MRAYELQNFSEYFYLNEVKILLSEKKNTSFFNIFINQKNNINVLKKYFFFYFNSISCPY